MPDVLILGGGTAGCVLAGRLSEDPDLEVLLLEAGSDDLPREARIPAAFSRLFRTDADWNYRTAPQERLGGRRLYWPRGRMVGGCSSMNAQIHVRGHEADFLEWRRAGAEGWGPSEVLPWFVRSEESARGPAPGRGTAGPLPVATLPTSNPVTGAFVQAAGRRGIPTAEDLGGPRPEGAGVAPVNQRKGRRWSAREAYLDRARSRPNLRIRDRARVRRILVEDGRATGVEYADGNGGLERASARQEIVLCAGAVGSPALLMHSGLGPANRLRELGIRVEVDLPGVGRNLQDHLAAGIAVRCVQPVSLQGAESLPTLLRWFVSGRGPLTSNVAEGLAILRSDPALPAPDLELLCAPTAFLEHGFRQVEGHALTVGAVGLRPRSRGRIRLSDGDPGSAPVIDPGYLTDPEGADEETLLRGLERCRELLETPPLRDFVGAPLEPAGSLSEPETLRDHLRDRAQTLYHPVGTCRMGGDGDEEAVVDPGLRVRGLEGLRVADASVMPTLVRGHTHAATVMIAERAAAWIAGDGP